VWRGSALEGLATRHPLTYSFIPNLVWLPEQVATLTDRPGSFAQTFLQALSLKIYRGVVLPHPLRMIVTAAWARLPKPRNVLPEQALPDVSQLSFFEPSGKFIERRKQTLRMVIHALDARTNAGRPKGKVISGRYTSGLRRLDLSAAKKLRSRLRGYARAVQASDPV
jgi:hypothetical protein